MFGLTCIKAVLRSMAHLYGSEGSIGKFEGNGNLQFTAT